MTAARRVEWNFALQRAIGWARALARPLVVVEVLECGGRWDSDRRHRFVVQGMRDNAARFARSPATYHPYVEPRPGEARRLFRALGRRACLFVADDHPIAAPDVQTADGPAEVRIEKVDGNGLLPLRAADRAFPTAHAFRRFLQRTLPEHLLDAPRPHPLARVDLARLASLPAAVARHWPAAGPQLLAGEPTALATLPLDHCIAPASTVGGPLAAHKRWKAFLAKQLAGYGELRNQPDNDATSGLAPYLHFGHISVHEVFQSLASQEHWSPANLAELPRGDRAGWWGMSPPAEAFLDQLVTWRELGFNCCAHRLDYAAYASLPAWAQVTLAKHARDPRTVVYELADLASARTHDPLWNAGQRQLAVEGRIHNYLRMLWGKKILEWTPSPQDALEIMIELNNRYALDGEDPNSYSGIFWVLGRYDRPWGPERPVFGTVRYMSSANAARKLRTAEYIARWSAAVDRGCERKHGRRPPAH
jgi:deoxyribodipyrimidine photo-lyase